MGIEPLCFSIIIPTYNRPKQLATCLQSLTQLDYPRDRFEVIVVDDGGEVSLETVVAPFQQQLDIILVKQSHAGPATARNTGAARARGKFLAFTDDDCTPFPDWLQALAARFTVIPDCMVGGQILNALPDNLYSTASQLLIDYLYRYYNPKPDQAHFFTSNNIALPTERFCAIGGFDTTYPRAAAEDRELCERWLNKGYPMLYASKVRVHHAHYLTLAKFWRQHFHYGRGAFCFRQVRSRRALEPIRVEPGSFYFNLLTYPLSQASHLPAIALAALFVVSQVANVAGFFWERLNRQ